MEYLNLFPFSAIGETRNCLTGGAVPAQCNFFRSGDCFDVPLHIHYAFAMRVENNIHIVNIAC